MNRTLTEVSTGSDPLITFPGERYDAVCMYAHIFGPVHSRRLGRSLGVDLLPHKTCSFDCVFCECGMTDRLTLKRQEFFPIGEVIQELDRFLSQKPALDVITFAGSGEPTLSLSIRPVISFLKEKYPYPIAILTNSSLLAESDVRSDILAADLVIPTLSTVVEETFDRINRPAPGFSLPSMIDGLVRFRTIFTGKIWLEVFIIDGLNTSEEELSRLRDVILRIKPDKVQLNSLDRPGTEEWVQPAPSTVMRTVKYLLNIRETEIV